MTVRTLHIYPSGMGFAVDDDLGRRWGWFPTKSEAIDYCSGRVYLGKAGQYVEEDPTGELADAREGKHA